MKSLVSIYKNNLGKLKTSAALPLLVIALAFPLSLHAEENQQGTNSSVKINTAFSKISSSVDENSENENEEAKDETDTKGNNNYLNIKLVEVPEKERPKIKINLTKDYKKTNIKDQHEDTYQRSVYKRVDSTLSEPELKATAETVCSEYRPNKRKNYNIYFNDEKSGKPLANYNCGNL